MQIPEKTPFVLVVLAVLLLVAWFFWPKPVETGTIEISVFDAASDALVPDAAVFLADGEKDIATRIAKGGIAEFPDAPLKTLVLRVKQRGFEDFEKTIEASPQKLSFTVRLTPLPRFSADQPLEGEVEKPLDSMQLRAEDFSYCGDGIKKEGEFCDTQAGCDNANYCSANCTCIVKTKPKGEIVLGSIKKPFSKGENFVFGEFQVQVVDVAAAAVSIKVLKKGNELSGLRFLPQGEEWRATGFIVKMDGFEGQKPVLYIALVEEPEKIDFQAQVASPLNGSIEAKMISEITGTASAQEGIDFVEVSLDGGLSWNKALGAEKWVYRTAVVESGWKKIAARVKSGSAYSNLSEPVQAFFSSCKLLMGDAEQNKAIDLIIVPSKFTSLSKFKASIDDNVNELLSEPVFAKNPELKKKINFYYYASNVECKIAGTTSPLNRMWKCDLPDNFFAACSFADIFAILVNSTVYGGTSGNPFAQTAGQTRVFVHETGHAIFNLADRYCCDGAYWEETPFQTLWRSSALCSLQASAETASVPCRKLGNTGWAEMETDSIMQKIEFNFDQREEQRIKWVLEKYG